MRNLQDLGKLCILLLLTMFSFHLWWSHCWPLYAGQCVCSVVEFSRTIYSPCPSLLQPVVFARQGKVRYVAWGCGAEESGKWNGSGKHHLEYWWIPAKSLKQIQMLFSGKFNLSLQIPYEWANTLLERPHKSNSFISEIEWQLGHFVCLTAKTCGLLFSPQHRLSAFHVLIRALHLKLSAL